MIDALPADLVAAVLAFGGPREANAVRALATRAAFRLDGPWKGFCARLWRGKQNFEGRTHPLVGVFRAEGGVFDRVALDAVAMIYMTNSPFRPWALRQRRLDWRESYRYSLQDATRKRLYVHELETRPWLRTDGEGGGVRDARRRMRANTRRHREELFAPGGILDGRVVDAAGDCEPLHPRIENELSAVLAENVLLRLGEGRVRGSGFIQFCAEMPEAILCLCPYGKFVWGKFVDDDLTTDVKEENYWELNGDQMVHFGDSHLSISRREDWGWRLEAGLPSGNGDYTLVESCCTSIKQTKAWREHTPWLNASGAFTPQVARVLKYSDDWRDEQDPHFGEVPTAAPEPYPGLKKETSDALKKLARLLSADHPGHLSAFEAFAKDLVADPDRASA